MVFQENKKRREPQGRRGPMQRSHKARQQEADKERVAGKAGHSSQPTRSPPRKDKALPDNQPHTNGCGLTPCSGHLPPMVNPASSTHTAAGRSSGAVEVRNGAHGYRHGCAPKQLPCNRDTKMRTDLPSTSSPAIAGGQLCRQPPPPQDGCLLRLSMPQH